MTTNMVAHRATIIAIANQKGSVGKTTSRKVRQRLQKGHWMCFEQTGQAQAGRKAHWPSL